jgi:hypothetical protein
MYRKLKSSLIVSLSALFLVLSAMPSKAGTNSDQISNEPKVFAGCTNVPYVLTFYFYKLTIGKTFPSINSVTTKVSFDGNIQQDNGVIVPPSRYVARRVIKFPGGLFKIGTLSGSAQSIKIVSNEVVISTYTIPALPVNCNPQPPISQDLCINVPPEYYSSCVCINEQKCL